MSVFTGTTPTQHAKKYVESLSKHWSHKFEVSQLDDCCEITLPLGLVKLIPTSDQLEIRLHPDEPDNTLKMRQVVTEHLDRFAFREAPLQFDW